jgi:hypothetical protein
MYPGPPDAVAIAGVGLAPTRALPRTPGSAAPTTVSHVLAD